MKRVHSHTLSHTQFSTYFPSFENDIFQMNGELLKYNGNKVDLIKIYRLLRIM